MAASDQEIVFRLSAKNLTSAEFAKARRDLLGVGDASKKAQASMSPLGGAVKNASSEFARMNPATARLSGLMGGASVATLGAVGAIGALAAAASAGVGNVVALGDQITTLSAKTGLSTDFLQELSHAADILDVPFESAANSISKLQVNLGKVRPSAETLDALESMGLSIAELKALAPEEQFLRVADSLSRVTDQSQLAANAQGLFGRAGVELIPLLKGNYRELADEAHSLGLVLDEELLEAGDELGENWELLLARSEALLSKGVSPLVKGLNELLDVLNSPADDRGFLSKLATSPLQLVARALGLVTAEVTDLEKQTQLAALGMLDFGSATTTAAMSAEDQIALLLQQKKETEELSATAKFLGISTKELLAIVGESGESFLDQATAMREAAEAAEKAAKASEVVGKRLKTEIFLRDELIKKIDEQLGRAIKPRKLEEAIPLPPTGIAGDLLDEVNETIERTKEWEKAQELVNERIAAAADLVRILPGPLGEVVGLVASASASFDALKGLGGGSVFGGLKDAFKAGSAGGGIGGLLGGISAVASFAGPFVGLGITAGKFLVKGLKSLFGGRDGQDAAAEIARDLGATVNKELADQIAKTGRPVQLAVADIFRSGGFGNDIDRFAEEIGDLFSFRARGEISQDELFGSLKEALPLLKERLAELGPAGEEQLQRIKAAAEQAGIDLKALGFDIDELNAKLEDSFAPQTLEQLQETLGLTADEVRALGEELGINIQTNLERAAASVGLTADEFKNLQAAAAEALGRDNLSIDELLDFLKATGVSAEELAATLGVDVVGGADGLTDAQSEANDRITFGADEAERMRDAIKDAASFSGGISFPGAAGSGSGFAEGTGGRYMNFGPGTPTTLHGVEAVVNRPSVPALAADIARALGGSVGGGVNVDLRGATFTGTPQENAAAIEQIIVKGMRNGGRMKDAIVSAR